MMIKWLSAASALIWMTGLEAAEPGRIDAPADKTWVHKASSFRFPPNILGFVREDMRDYSGEKRIDLSAAYQDRATGTTASLYIYRPPLAFSALWFDAASWFIGRNSRFGIVSPAGGPIAFSVASQRQSASLRQSYMISEQGRGSGLAIVPFGPWLVKLRMTSRTFEPHVIDATMHAFLQAIPWPSRMPPAGDSSPIFACTGKLPDGTADEIQQDSSVILIGAMAASMAQEAGQAETPRLCRDNSRTDLAYPLYQLDDGANGYLIPIGDNGTLLAVRNDETSAAVASELAGDKSEGAKLFFRITVMTPEKWEQYPAFAKLPSIEQAFSVVQERRPLSVTDLTAKGSTIKLDPATFK